MMGGKGGKAVADPTSSTEYSSKIIALTVLAKILLVESTVKAVLGSADIVASRPFEILCAPPHSPQDMTVPGPVKL